MIEEIKKTLNEAISNYVTKFCEKHELEFDYWVADLTGTIGVFGDYFFNFEDIRLDLEKDIPENKIFEWYDLSLELGMQNKPVINYYNWLKLKKSKVKDLNVEFKKAREEVINQLKNSEFMKTLKLKRDLGDIGNEIGIAIAKHFSEEVGFNKESFFKGIKHGISLTEGTH